jgi:large subunit ribosomal protein L10
MSKPVKNLITESYRKRFAQLDGAVLIDIRGVKSNDTNRLRSILQEKQVRVTVVKNSLAARAVQGTAIENLNKLLDGPNAVVYGGDSVVTLARDLLKWAKEVENLTINGAIMDGQVFGPDEIEALSKYPTRAEAQAQVVQIFLTPGQKLVGSILGPGRKIASLIKAIEEKLEKGETIAKAG